ncbi:MAG: hypothetical protein KDC54_22040, partial [Lewinella sp.]|nr:hypothetical protein [Lewinella sp.]
MITRTTFVLFILTLFVLPLAAQLTVSPLFTDHMVVQRERPLRIWGTGSPGKTVELRVLEQRYTSKVDPDGHWKIVASPLPTGGPYRLALQSGRDQLTIADVLVGDVWICSGQSNMEWVVSGSNDAEREMAAAHDTRIRHFKVPNSFSETPSDELAGGMWEVTSPETVGNFTAVGYFFARELRQEMDVPIGLINTSWGGSRIEAWMSAEAQQLADPAAAIAEYRSDILARIEARMQALR